MTTTASPEQVLDAAADPGRLRAMGSAELAALAAEIRSFLVHRVCATGGHLGPNLGWWS